MDKILFQLRKVKRTFKKLTSNQKPIVFDHLPKCAGTTVNNYLTSSFLKNDIYSIAGDAPKKSVEKFKVLPEKERFKKKLIYGHLANELFDYANPKAVFAVVLREPVDRIISHYFYVKRTKVHYLHDILEENNISLKEYCSHNLSSELTNWYVSHFSGLNNNEIENKPKDAVEKAFKKILNTYDVIGFQDDIPSFINKLAHVAKIKSQFNNEIKNKTPKRINIKNIDKETLESISKMNSLDIELYTKLNSLRKNGEI